MQCAHPANNALPRSVESKQKTSFIVFTANTTDDHVPQCLTETEGQNVKLLNCFSCKHCKSRGSRCCPAKNHCPGKCPLLHCPNKKRTETVHRSCSNWFVCCVCKKIVDKQRVKHHFVTRLHTEKWKIPWAFILRHKDILNVNQALLMTPTMPEARMCAWNPVNQGPMRDWMAILKLLVP